MKMTKPNLVRFVCCLLAFGAALVWPVQRILQFECSKDYTLHRFKVTLYDPYDPMRGRFLRLQALPRTYRTKQEFSGWNKPAWIKLGRDKEGFATIERFSREPIAEAGCLKVKFHREWSPKKEKNKDYSYTVLYPFDRYFINEELAADAEAALVNTTKSKRQAEIRVRIYRDGSFMIEELLLDGKPLREILREAPKHPAKPETPPATPSVYPGDGKTK